MTIFVCSCAKGVVYLPSDHRIYPAIDFCGTVKEQAEYICLSKAEWLETESLLIQCKEVLQHDSP
jgi:hypothetical protein